MLQDLATTSPNFPCFLFVGPSGTSKTTFMTRFKFPGQLSAILDADGNLAGPKLVAEKEKRDIGHVKFASIRFEDDGKTPVAPLQQFVRLATKLQWIKSQKLPDGRPLFGFVGVTSTTTLSDIFANEVRRQMGKPVDYAFQIQDWGKYAYLWNYFIMETLRGMPCTTALDAHQKVEKDQMDSVLRYVLNIPGNTAETMTAKMTDVFLAGVEQKLDGVSMRAVYTMTTIQSARIPGMKTSLGLPAQFPANQEWADKIVAQIVGGQTSSVTPTLTK